VTASVQYRGGANAAVKRAQVVSRICMFFLSTTPFCCGVWEHVVSWYSPHAWKYSCNSLLSYSPPLSEQRI